LLLLTGARASEVCAAAPQEFDVGAAVWVIPSARVKNGLAHRVPLSDAALEVVQEALAVRACDRPWLLPSIRGAGHVTLWGTLDALQRILGSTDVTVHDIRRTVATGLQKLGIQLEVTEAVLNHVSGSRGGIVGVYQRHDWAVEKRAALDRWARHVLALAAGEAAIGNVIPLPLRVA
jgi:integrase